MGEPVYVATTLTLLIVVCCRVPEPVSRGWALVGGYVAVYMCIAASTAVYWDKVGRL